MKGTGNEALARSSHPQSPQNGRHVHVPAEQGASRSRSRSSSDAGRPGHKYVSDESQRVGVPRAYEVEAQEASAPGEVGQNCVRTRTAELPACNMQYAMHKKVPKRRPKYEGGRDL